MESYLMSIEEQLRQAEIDYIRFTCATSRTERSGTWVKLEIARLKKLLKDRDDIDGRIDN